MSKILKIIKKSFWTLIANIIFVKEVGAYPAIKYGPVPMYGPPVLYGPPPSPVISYLSWASIILIPVVVLVTLILGILWYLKKISKKVLFLILGIVWFLLILLVIIYNLLINRFGY